MSVQLRDYQQDALANVIKEQEKGCSRQLITAATGSGKTILLSAIIKHFNRKTLVIAHSDELIEQTYQKIKNYWPAVSVGVCKAERNELDAQVVVGTVQTCSQPKRLAQLKEMGFEILIIDECHHINSKGTYRKIIDELGFSTDKNKLLIGCTATPHRLDSFPLVGEIFQKETVKLSIGSLIRTGYLAPVMGRKILTNTPIKKIKSHMGDFAQGELAHAINNRARNIFIAEKYKQYAAGRKAVAFCVNVKHAQDLAQVFTDQGIKCAAVWGAMPSHERKQVLSDFREGRLEVVTSVGVLTEGFDEPSISCILVCRGTKSRSLYVQCVGRGLRVHNGKTNCLVLDFTDRYHSLSDAGALVTLKTAIPEAQMLEDKLPKQEKEIEKEPPRHVVNWLTEECDKEYNLLNQSKFIWVPIGDSEYSLTADDYKEIVVTPSSTSKFIAHIYDIDGSCRQLILQPLSLPFAFDVCEAYAIKHWSMNYATLQEDWLNKPATPGQTEYLKRQRAYKHGMTKAQAFMEIRKIAAKKNKQWRKMAREEITPAQKFTLEKLGYDTKDMNRLVAYQTIAAHKQEHRAT